MNDRESIINQSFSGTRCCRGFECNSIKKRNVVIGPFLVLQVRIHLVNRTKETYVIHRQIEQECTKEGTDYALNRRFEGHLG